MHKILFTLISALLISACASVEDLAGNNPIIDTQGVNLAQYDAHLAQCQSYADEVAIAQKSGKWRSGRCGSRKRFRCRSW